MLGHILPAALLAITAAQWQADLSYLKTELPKRHANLFFHLPQSEFNIAVEDLKQRADSDDVEMVLRLQQIVASVGDAHTEADTRRPPQTFFPIRLYRFSDGIFVTKTTEASRGTCGARLIAIDGMPADEVYDRVSTLISHENDAWVAARFSSQMTRAETLAMLGVTASPDHARFTFETTNGVRFDADLTAIPVAEAGGSVLAPYGTDDASPLYLRSPRQNYWYTYDAERRLLYVKYNVCTNDPARPFDAFAKEVLNIADHQRVDRFVIDVRNNTGGNSSVAKALIDGLAQRTEYRERVYVIIGRETFSSGMLNALQLQKAGAIVAGEPSGGKPNGYGEVKSFALPNSATMIYYSTKYFSDAPSGDPPSIEPDLPVALTSSDFFSRRDPVLDAIAPIPFAAASVAPARRRSVSMSRTCPQ